MNDLEQRVKALETKVKILEETLETIKNMQISDQMDGYIKSRTKSLKMVDLVNRLSDKPEIDFDKEAENLRVIQAQKRSIDNRIAAAMQGMGTFSEQYPDDPRYFNYEVETGTTTDYFDDKVTITELRPFVGKTIRITSYNGFESERVIVPAEINGYTVVSIGENAFKNASLSEIILPNTVKAILKNAFEGCSNLRNLDLPDGLLYLGENCFQSSGLESIAFPNAITKISNFCCDSCTNLRKISFGNGVKQIEYSAFRECSNLREVSLPDSLENIEFSSFEGVPLTVVILPSSLKKISHKAFSDSSFSTNSTITCVFLGKETSIDSGRNSYESFYNVGLVYCLPGSNVQKFAREHKLQMKPLSEFRMEDYQ